MFEGATNNRPHDDLPSPAVNRDKIKIPHQLQLDQSAEDAIKAVEEEAEKRIKSAQKQIRIIIAILIPIVVFSSGINLASSVLSRRREEAVISRNDQLRDKLAKAKAELKYLRPTLDNCNNVNYQNGTQVEDMNIFIDELNKCGRAHDVYQRGLCFEGAMQENYKRQKKNRKINK